MFKFKKNRKKKIALLAVSAIVLIGSASLIALSYYGRMMMQKIPALSFADALGYTLKDNPEALITVGTVKDGRSFYTVYGSNSQILPAVRHTYEIGSLTKTFTAALVGRAVEEGRIQLDQTIDQYLSLPKGRTYPTVADLLTHTSGYKPYYFEWPMASNFLSGKNDFYGITKDRLTKKLQAIKWPDKIHGYLYSNFGYAALGLILEGIYEKDFASLMDDYLAHGLKLNSTRLSDQTGDLAGYWDWNKDDAYLPAGGLLSDIEDMLAYARMQLAEEGIFRAAHRPLRQIDATTDENAMMDIRLDAIGMAWIIDEDHYITWHNGGTGHFNSYLGFDQDNGTAVVILSNLSPNSRIPATVLGVKLMEELRNAN